MSEDVSSKVKKIVADHLGIDESKVTEESSFIDDLGADSLDTVELVMTNSTVSRLSAPKSSIKLDSSVTFDSSIPKWSATIFLTLLETSSDILILFLL